MQKEYFGYIIRIIKTEKFVKRIIMQNEQYIKLKRKYVKMKICTKT